MHLFLDHIIHIDDCHRIAMNPLQHLSRTGSLARTILWPVLALLATATIGCTREVNVHSAISPTARFDTYRTFEFRANASAPAFYHTSDLSIDVCERVQVQASEALVRKGYAESTDGKPDLILWVAAGRRERRTREPEPIRPGWLEEDEEQDFVEGSFVIDAFDASTRELVWHGGARTQVDPREVDAKLLGRAVQSVMSRFPARATIH
jgi:hypothetical protein